MERIFRDGSAELFIGRKSARERKRQEKGGGKEIKICSLLPAMEREDRGAGERGKNNLYRRAECRVESQWGELCQKNIPLVLYSERMEIYQHSSASCCTSTKYVLLQHFYLCAVNVAR